MIKETTLDFIKASISDNISESNVVPSSFCESYPDRDYLWWIMLENRR